MARFLLAGGWLNAIAGSTTRYPRFQVLVWNPNQVTINQVADGSVSRPPLDISAFVESIEYSENIGFENGDDPSVTQATFNLKRQSNRVGIQLRRGLLEDGVIVQIREGDVRIPVYEWIPTFTGTFRGRPGDDPGTPAESTEGLQATAYGREERFLNLSITTESFKLDQDAEPPETEIDLGDIAATIAQRHLGLGQNEILFGSQGVVTKHLVNQIVETPALQAIWECLFPAGKKPKFDSLGRLVAVDANLFKPPARVYSAGDMLIRSKRAAPNEVEVNNSVVLRGLAHELTKILSEDQLLVDFQVTTGFFDEEYNEKIYYSDDHSQRADETHLVTKKKIKWSDASWVQVDEFHGKVEIDTHHLKTARIIIFVLWLAVQIAVAVIDFYFQALALVAAIGTLTGASEELAAVRLALQLASLATMAALLWAMQFVGRGRYQIWGRPFEYVYQELVSQSRLIGLLPEDVREIEFRNDFVSDIDSLDALAKEHLRRELVKDQVYEIEVLDDPLLEVDDVIETANGDRFYIVSVSRTIRSRQAPVMQLTCWKVQDGALLAVDGVVATGAGA